MKDMVTPKEVCKGCPPEFEKFLDYSNNLEMNDQPDYMYLIDLLKQSGINHHINIDRPIIWKAEERNLDEDTSANPVRFFEKSSSYMHKVETGSNINSFISDNIRSLSPAKIRANNFKKVIFQTNRSKSIQTGFSKNSTQLASE